MIFSHTYRLIALDIDGTIINSAHRLTDPVRLALRQVADHGLHVVLVSARTPRSVLDFCHQIGLDDLAVALNGAQVVNQAGELLYREPLAQADLQAIISLGERYDLTVNVFAGFDWYVDRVDALVEQEAEIIGFRPRLVPSLQQQVDEAEKILVMGEPEPLRLFHQEITRRSLQLSAAFSKPIYCEITRLGINKVTGLSYICRQLSISASAVIAVGDNFNDLDMFRFAGFSVAMGNAPAAVQQAAHVVIGSNDEDGVADFCSTLDNF